MFEKEAMKDIKDFENIKRLYPEDNEIINDIQSLISFGVRNGTYMPKEADELKEKLIDAKIKQIIDFFDKIYEEQKTPVDLWFPEFKEVYSDNEKYIKLCYLSHNQIFDCLSIEDFYEKVVSYRVGKILGTRNIDIPTLRLLVKLEKDLLCEYIKLEDPFGETKQFVPYLKQQLSYLKSKEYKLKPRIITEAKWISEDNENQ